MECSFKILIKNWKSWKKLFWYLIRTLKEKLYSPNDVNCKGHSGFILAQFPNQERDETLIVTRTELPFNLYLIDNMERCRWNHHEQMNRFLQNLWKGIIDELITILGLPEELYGFKDLTCVEMGDV